MASSEVSAHRAGFARPSALTFQVGTVVALTILLVVSALADSLPIAGRTSADVSRAYGEAFSPAAYALGIWSAVYAALAVYAIYQALPEQRQNPRIMAITPWFWLSCAAHVTAVFLWHYLQLTAALVAMAMLVVTVGVVYYLLHRTRAENPPSTAELWCAHVPFSLYLGWVTVTALAHANIWAVHMGLRPAVGAPEVWAVVTIAVAALLATALGWMARDPVVLAAVLWGLAAIIVRHGFPHPVSVTALGASVILAAVLVRAIHLNGSRLIAPLPSGRG